jgi:hypothetical protein
LKHRLLTCAAAIAGVAAATLTVTSAAAVAAPSRAATATSLPPFVVVGQGSSLKVITTSTGATAGTLDAPAGLQFEGVASGGTGQTFLAVAGPASVTAACHAYYYRFQLAASGKPSAPALLRSITGSLPTAIAAEPGGGSYAYSAVHCDTAPNGVIGISGAAGNRTWAYDEADDYTSSLAATSGASTLALSLSAGNHFADLLLNTRSGKATVDEASRVVPSAPYGDTLAISPDGTTLYACVASGPAPQLAAYSTATGKLIKVLHRWTGASGTGRCQVSADATGKFLLAGYVQDSASPVSLTGINLGTGSVVNLPAHAAEDNLDGIEAAW